MELVIIGAGGHGKVIAEIAKKIGYDIKGFIDDDKSKKHICNFPILGGIDSIEKYRDNCFFVAIGNNKTRKEIIENLESLNLKVITLIDPSAVISKTVEIKPGTVIMPNVTINVDSKIGKGCIINTASSIDHDCYIDDFVHICPGVHIAGTVVISHETCIGIGATIINNINIGSKVMIGAGSVIVKSIGNNVMAYGVPARVISGGEINEEI